MNLVETLQLIALQIETDPGALIQFASEDMIGGYHPDAAQSKWMIGSVWEVEGKILYALVRALQPAHVVEIGSLRGCSTTHLATALDVNGRGRITSVDVSGDTRDQFPKHLEALHTAVTGDGLEWLAGQDDASIDLLFEDSSHGEAMCMAVATLAKDKLTPGGLLILHDAAHDKAIIAPGHAIDSPVGAEVRRGLDRAIEGEYRVYLTEPSDCGFALWQRPLPPENPKRHVTTAGDRPSPVEATEPAPKKKTAPKKRATKA